MTELLSRGLSIHRAVTLTVSVGVGVDHVQLHYHNTGNERFRTKIDHFSTTTNILVDNMNVTGRKNTTETSNIQSPQQEYLLFLLIITVTIQYQIFK